MHSIPVGVIKCLRHELLIKNMRKSYKSSNNLNIEKVLNENTLN